MVRGVSVGTMLGNVVSSSSATDKVVKSLFDSISNGAKASEEAAKETAKKEEMIVKGVFDGIDAAGGQIRECLSGVNKKMEDTAAKTGVNPIDVAQKDEGQVLNF